jgi:hypothetical protein
LSLEGVHNIHGCDSLALGMLGVGDSVTDHILKEYLKNTTSLLVDESRDTLHTSTTSQTANGRLGDTLDVITQNLAMPLGTSLSETLSSFTTSSHDECEMAYTKVIVEPPVWPLYILSGRT